MQTGVLSGLQLTAMFPNLVLENFYTKTQHSIDAGKTDAPFGYVIPAGKKDMTRSVTLVNILRAQRIEVGTANAEIKIGGETVPGRLVRDQARSAVRQAREEPPRNGRTIPIPT